MKRFLTIAILILCELNINIKATKIDYGLGLIPTDAAIASQYRATSPVLDVTVPSNVDLSFWLPSIGDQRHQASCVGWALAYYYKTYQENRERNWGASIPEHCFSPAWVYNQRPSTCEDEGMTFPEGFLILVTKGAATEATFPYDPFDSCTQPSAKALQEAAHYRTVRFSNIYQGRGTANLERLKVLLASGKPFALAVPVYDSFFTQPENVPRHSIGDNLYGYHALFIIGFDDASETFKAANSWGEEWGIGGYAYLSYAFVQHDAFEAWTMEDQVEKFRCWLPILAKP